ncbi:Formyltransferase/hydrolase complex Fhc subunit A [Hartmannibacter diazotrophicus]|uniref:Formyltransferase/hydrolase complex Fhc subunit A n=1 Tax=Hartmannibacter diazotrophicus TaxID=1482074 RepID=A0A2C9D6C0_9HYPH|nr:formylmethanofuran dehydrogenase subunit A [Hartmannibacter diazotrophicus]SON55846.1 Formyltransferase/hydrolase complex Fhc subunit A [Hartmannibacter diazotrophicus]
MLVQIKGGKVVDPVNGATSVRDVFIRDGVVVSAPETGEVPDVVHDARSKIVMAGAIDVHSHIAGGNVTLSRLLLPDLHVSEDPAAEGLPFGTAKWSTWETGRLYAEMGFTTVIEPALTPTHALHTHLELADIPIIDRGALTVIGNDDYFLSQLRSGESRDAIRDHIAYHLAASRGLGVKLINAGGPAAFHSGLRAFDLDDVVPHYGASSRQIISAMLDAVADVGVPHPLHLHANNLAVPGAPKTIADTIAAADGRRLHFAHIQFYSYGQDEDGGMVSGAEDIIRSFSDAPNITMDVGQVMFGPTVTISLDLIKQWAGRVYASPKKWMLQDGDAEGGGIVPLAYKKKNWVNELQWAIGMELFLLSPDPWRMLLTTDHPNGGSFTTYPKIMHLLMDREERKAWVEAMPEMARNRTGIASIDREYTMEELAIMTRAAPAKLLGLNDRGHLGAGAVGDVAIYDDLADRTAMFTSARLVLKGGDVVVKDGKALGWTMGQTLHLKPGYDAAMDRRMKDYLDDRFGVGPSAFAVPEAAFGERENFKVAPCLK